MSYKNGGLIPGPSGEEYSYAKLNAILSIKGSCYQHYEYQKSAFKLLEQIKKDHGFIDWESGVNCVF